MVGKSSFIVSVFATELGAMGLVWQGRDLVRVQLPEKNCRQVILKLRQLYSDCQEQPIAAWQAPLVEGLQKYMACRSKGIPLQPGQVV